MEWYQYLCLGALLYCLASMLSMGTRLIKLGLPKDLAKRAGDIKEGIRYAHTDAMHPSKKESAYLHLPTYSMGMIFHLCTFLSLGVLLISFFIADRTGERGAAYEFFTGFFTGLISLGALSGLFLLIKRLFKKELKSFSNADDYMSNFLTTLFQIMTVLSLAMHEFTLAYYLCASVLLLYMPLGKLRHAVYYFSARTHLGYFYGSRGVWPEKKKTDGK